MWTRSLIIAAAALFIALNNLFAVDLDKAFKQDFSKNFWKEFKLTRGPDTAVFLKFPSQDYLKAVYMRLTRDNETIIIKGKLSKTESTQINPEMYKYPATNFKGYKSDDSVLYGKGIAHHGILDFTSHSKGAKFLFVPYIVDQSPGIKGIPNDAFLSDLGYFHLKVLAKDITSYLDFSQLLNEFLGTEVKIARTVEKNRYYLFSNSYYGPVHRICGSLDNYLNQNHLLPPGHKLTLNKHVTDRDLKTVKDAKMVQKILFKHQFLLSQDERLKNGLVPGHVNLGLTRIKNTDIGSGQNHLVFLSVGPGINYFDDPWKKTPENVPCPRVYLDPVIYHFEKAQFYPSYSIDPSGLGLKRAKSINDFQTPDFQTPDHKASEETPSEVTYMNIKYRNSYLSRLEESLFDYGLLNDSSETEMGFKFDGQEFRGNPVNNEVRINAALSLFDLVQLIIIPKGSYSLYEEHFHEAINGYLCGVPIKQVFQEAPFNTDKGFRIAFLLHLLKRSRPGIVRLCKVYGSNKHSLVEFLDKVEELIKKQGRSFFETTYYEYYKKLERECHLLWLDYLEARREKKTNKAKSLFSTFKRQRMRFDQLR